MHTIPITLSVSEAAFYGPKLDIQVKIALGNEETLLTIQLDFCFQNVLTLYTGAMEKNTVQSYDSP